MRNYERIQQMSIEEMAQFLSDIQYDTNEPTTEEMLQYLESECDGDGK